MTSLRRLRPTVLDGFGGSPVLPIAVAHDRNSCPPRRVGSPAAP